MKLTLNKASALKVLRYLRSSTTSNISSFARTGIVAPNPSPHVKWTRKAFAELLGDYSEWLLSETLDVAVPQSRLRLGSRLVMNTVYSQSIPDNSFISLGDVAISCPELLFVETAEAMNPIEHLMLGHELCGTFSRDAVNPRNGVVAYGVPPATSVQRIANFINQAQGMRGIEQARQTLSVLNDNAWSPVESLIAAFLTLPGEKLGYDLGELVLNPRVEKIRELPGSKSSRVPDIMIARTSVGINYDGLQHLDLKAIAKAGIEAGRCLGSNDAEIALKNAISSVRLKHVDDIRRNRELSASSLTVFPVLKEDLYTFGGFDQLVSTILNTLERRYTRDHAVQRALLADKELCAERYRMVLSLLPGR